MKVGVRTIPKDLVSDCSGDRPGFPPKSTLHCAAGQFSRWPYLAGSRPEATQPARLAVSVGEPIAPAQGSEKLPRPAVCGVNSSSTFGARTARLKLPRSLTSSTICHSAPYLYAVDAPAVL